MGKYILQYVLPAFVVLPTLWWGVRRWYVKRYGKTVDQQVAVKKATAKYDKKLGINQPTTKKGK